MPIADRGPFLATGLAVAHPADGLPKDFEHHLRYRLVFEGQDGIKLAGQLQEANPRLGA